MVQVTVGKWGNNLAVRLPNEVAQAIALRDGERLDIGTENGLIILRRVKSALCLDEMFEGRTPEAWRAVYAGAHDRGPDVGREIVGG